MKKFLVLLFLVFTFSNLFSQQNNSYKTTTNLNLRSEPNKDSKVLKLLENNEKIFCDSLGSEWSKISTLDGNSGFVKTEYIANENGYKNSNVGSFFGNFNQTYLYIILGILFITYIIAIVKSKNNTMVAIAGWQDLALLLVPIIGLVFVMCLRDKNNPSNDGVLKTAYLIISGIALLISFILSITSNKGNIFNIIISILAKLFVVLIVVIIITLIFGRSSPKKDARYRDGTRGNSNTKFIAFISLLATFAIMTLVKNKEEQRRGLFNIKCKINLLN